jgi:hypothetical protein
MRPVDQLARSNSGRYASRSRRRTRVLRPSLNRFDVSSRHLRVEAVPFIFSRAHTSSGVSSSCASQSLAGTPPGSAQHPRWGRAHWRRQRSATALAQPLAQRLRQAWCALAPCASDRCPSSVRPPPPRPGRRLPRTRRRCMCHVYSPGLAQTPMTPTTARRAAQVLSLDVTARAAPPSPQIGPGCLRGSAAAVHELNTSVLARRRRGPGVSGSVSCWTAVPPAPGVGAGPAPARPVLR